MRILRLVAGLVLGGAGAATAQLAIQQPTEKLLLLPLAVKAPADSAASIATMTSQVVMSAKASIRVLSIDHQGIGSSPAGKGTRSNFEKIR